MKHTVDQLLGHDPWEIEIAFHLSNGMDAEMARLLTIMRWMELGDLRPLRAAIIKAPALDDENKMVAIDGAILGYLKKLIEEDRLVVKTRRRSRPQSPDKFARDLAGARLYELSDKKSSAAFRKIARDLHMTEAALREAVTRWRKNNTD